MRKIIFLVSVCCMVFPKVTYAFSDIQFSWYKDSIVELQEAWLVAWYGDGRFGPDDNVTRAEILAILLNAAKVEIPEVWDRACFPDVYLDSWYAPYVCYAAENGISSWYVDGNFKPNGSVSIIEALAFSTLVFWLDVERQSELWYEDFIGYADANMIIPQNAYTRDTLGKRGQIADIIVRSKSIFEGKQRDYKSIWCSAENGLAYKNTLVVNEKNRSYLLDLPENYTTTRGYPLVIWLHGRTNSSEMVRDYMWLRWGSWHGNETYDIVAAYPQGLGGWPYTWHEAENINFFDAMIRDISENLCIDRSQIHIVWHSLWGYFSNKLACVRGDVIQTMTSVAAPWYDTECNWPVVSLILHNSADRLVPYRDGLAATKIRKEKNQCSDNSQQINIWTLNCELWDDCSAWNAVGFCREYSTYGNVPHSWPKDGAEAIYEFIDMPK